MKKLNLLLGIIFLFSAINAQNIRKAIPTEERLQNIENKLSVNTKSQKTGETVIWSEDFGNGFPEGWINVNLAEDSILWEWTDQPIYGCYTPGVYPSDAETAENGFIVLNLDGYNSVPQYTNADSTVIAPNQAVADTYFQMTTIDLTEYDAVIIEFYQRVRVYSDFSSMLMVSKDYNPEIPEIAHWYTWATQNTPISWEVDEFKRINISDIAAGNDSVTIRFHMYGSTHYFWFIDDIKLLVPNANNMEVLDSWLFYDWFKEAPTGAAESGYLQHGGFYPKIPMNQVKSFVGMQMAVLNEGYKDQTNVILNTEIYHKLMSSSTDSTLVYTTQSEDKSISAYSIDTIFAEANYTPTDYGRYDVHMSVKMDSIDDFPSDNNAYYSFEITDSTYSRTTDNINSVAGTRHWVGGGIDGDGLGQYYRLYKDVTEVEALRFYFAESNDQFANLINAGGYTATAMIFGYNEVEENWQESPIISSNLWTAEMSDTGSFQTLYFNKDGSNEYLPAGDYLIFLETSTGVDEGTHPDANIGFYIGEDIETKQPDKTQFIWINNKWGWVSGTNFKFDLIINAADWDITSTNREVDLDVINSIILQQNYPNPAKEITEINYVLNESTNVQIVITDITGKEIYSQNEGLQLNGKHRFNLDVSRFDSGVYYYTLVTDKQKITRKLTIIN